MVSATAAELSRDVAVLDRGFDDGLDAIGPDGAHTKGDDLARWRRGLSLSTEMVDEQVVVLVAGTTRVEFFRARVASRGDSIHT